MKKLLDYDWPGNIRELEHAVEYAFVFVKGSVILPENLPQINFSAKTPLPEPSSSDSRKHLTKETIVQALKKSNGKKNQAALLLGISRTSLWRKMKKFNLSD